MALNRKDKRPDANNWWWMLWRPWQFIKTCTTVKIPTPRTRWGFTAGLHQGYRRNILWPWESEDWIQDHVILTAVVTSKLLVVFFFTIPALTVRKGKKQRNTDWFDHSIDQHEWWLGVVVYMQPCSIQLQQKLQTWVDVQSTQRHWSLPMGLSTAASCTRCQMHSDIIRLWAVQRVCSVRFCKCWFKAAHNCPHWLQWNLDRIQVSGKVYGKIIKDMVWMLVCCEITIIQTRHEGEFNIFC